MTKIKHFETNKNGTDYVVGDIHGCYDDLMQFLSILQFDQTKDRLFSVGDLIDRGPDSFLAGDLVNAPWFHAVRGNHEQMMVKYFVYKDVYALSDWTHNGGGWFYTFSDDELLELAKKFDELPYVISVGEGADRFNIVHAQLSKMDWITDEQIVITNQMLDNWEFDFRDEEDMVWGRGLLSTNAKHDIIQHHSKDLSLTFVGHTPVKEPIRVQKHLYLDTGATFYYYNHGKEPTPDANCLTVAIPSSQQLLSFSVSSKQIIRNIKFDDVRNITPNITYDK